MGHVATHAVVLARLITKGEDFGIHPFVVQIRSLEDHTPLPGKGLGEEHVAMVIRAKKQIGLTHKY